MASREQLEKNEIYDDDGNSPWVDDIYFAQKKYFKTNKGKKALKKARRRYDNKDAERRRKQKREYMRRKREKDPKVWR